MKTEFQAEHSNFSERAHIAAQRLIYPRLFNAPFECLQFEKTNVADGGEGAIMDARLGIDRIVGVRVPEFRLPLEFTIQERFRRPSYRAFDDLTITEWNHVSKQPSELYKLKAVFFVYGYYDEAADKFTQAVVADSAQILYALTRGELPYTRNRNPKGQEFICIKFTDLAREDALIYNYTPSSPITVPVPPRKGRRIHSIEEFQELWPKVLLRVKKKIGIIATAYLHDAQPAELNDENAVLEFSKELHYEKACQAAARLPFEQVLNECFASPHRLFFRLKRSLSPLPTDDSNDDDNILDLAQAMFAAKIIGRSQPTVAI